MGTGGPFPEVKRGRGVTLTTHPHLVQSSIMSRSYIPSPWLLHGVTGQLYFSSWRWGGSSTQACVPTYVSILCIPQMIQVWRATVEWYWQGKTEELWEKLVPVPLCPRQIPHGLTWARTQASAVRGRRLTTWAMARPTCLLTFCKFLSL
jgi:hypothetical protein